MNREKIEELFQQCADADEEVHIRFALAVCAAYRAELLAGVGEPAYTYCMQPSGPNTFSVSQRGWSDDQMAAAVLRAKQERDKELLAVVGEPARKKLYYCNRCGSFGDGVEVHKDGCHYQATSDDGPYYSADQTAAAVLKERKRWEAAQRAPRYPSYESARKDAFDTLPDDYETGDY